MMVGTKVSKARLIQRYTDALEFANAALKTFTIKLMEDPSAQMKWADSVYDTAARHKVASLVLWCLTTDETFGPGGRLDNLKANLLGSVMQGAKFPARSTSVSSNLMDQALLSAKADAYDFFQHYTELVD